MNEKRRVPGRYCEFETYQICIGGEIETRWVVSFEGLTVTTGQGNTYLSGVVKDQAALFGLLRKLRDLGLTLISVLRIETNAQFPPNH
ncbi:MAG: hypothetical protein V3U76_04020 [Granulosicoccus sp.]